MDDFWFWLGRIADIASLVALAVTIYVAWKVRSLQNRMIARGRTPELQEQLSKQASVLVAQLSEFSTRRNDIRSTLVGILASVQHLAQKAPKEFRAELEALASEIKRYVPRKLLY